MPNTPLKDDISTGDEHVVADAAAPSNGAAPTHPPIDNPSYESSVAGHPDPSPVAAPQSDETSSRMALSRLAALPRKRVTLGSIAKSILPSMPRGKKADKLLIIAGCGIFAMAAAIIGIGALNSLPGDPLPTPPSGASGGIGAGINITGGGALSEGGINITGGGAPSEGGAVGPPLVTDNATFSTDHIHLVDPAGGPETNTPTPTPTPNPETEDH